MILVSEQLGRGETKHAYWSVQHSGPTPQTDKWAGRDDRTIEIALQPPFDNAGVRRAVMAALNQEDFLRVATADNPALYTVCKSVFPCGRPSGDQAGSAAMPGDPAAAKVLLRQAGYGSEKVMLLGATDIPPVGDFAQIIADTMTRIGRHAADRASTRRRPAAVG